MIKFPNKTSLPGLPSGRDGRQPITHPASGTTAKRGFESKYMKYEDVIFIKSNLWTAIPNEIKDFPPLPPSLSALHAFWKLKSRQTLPRNQHTCSILLCVQELVFDHNFWQKLQAWDPQRCTLFSTAFSAIWSCLKYNKPYIHRNKSEQAGLEINLRNRHLEQNPPDVCIYPCSI